MTNTFRSSHHLMMIKVSAYSRGCGLGCLRGHLGVWLSFLHPISRLGIYSKLLAYFCLTLKACDGSQCSAPLVNPTSFQQSGHCADIRCLEAVFFFLPAHCSSPIAPGNYHFWILKGLGTHRKQGFVLRISLAASPSSIIPAGSVF